MRVLVISAGGDPTADLLVLAAQRLGHDAGTVDLRSDRLTLVVDPDGARVRRNGQTLAPEVVVNRSSVNGLGLASPGALVRQRDTSWRRRHVAAREEQGLLLAVFDVWQRSGVVVADLPRAADLALMPNAVIERLGRSGVPVNRSLDGTTEVLVARGRGVAHRGDEAGDAHLATALSVADAAEFGVGSVGLADQRGVLVVTGWSHQPELHTWPEPETVAMAVLANLVGETPAQLGESPPPFFVEDLGAS